MDKDRPIARAAMIRAAVLALMPTVKEPVTIQQIQKHPSLQELDATIPHVTSVVLDLHKKGTLKRVHITKPDEPNTKFAYEWPKGGEKVVPPTVVPRPAGLPPDVRLDIVKSTGRLRIEFRGLRVEIGTVD